MIGGRHPRLGIQWAAPPSGVPAPTLYLPLTADLDDDSVNGFATTLVAPNIPTIVSVTSPIASTAALFDGQRIEYADAALLNPGTLDFSVTAFLNATSSAAFPQWFSKGSYQSSTGAISVNRWEGDGNMYMGFGDPWRDASGGSLPLNTMRRCTIVRSGNTITFYNGTTAAGTVDATGLDLTSPSPFIVGANPSGNSWVGHILDFAYIRGTALTTGQISSLQTATYASLL
jgi:hypothetical protein